MAKHSESSTATNWTEDEAYRVLDAWEKSGETGAAFARSIGVLPQRLFWWRRRRGHGGRRPMPAFVPVVATAPRPTTTAALIVTTARGARIEVHDVDASTAAWVVAVLGERGSS